jgi:energy-coupling factor transporter ATP-binding protein EcfA2
MLSKLTVHGFKPFRNFAIDFSEFDVFVGRNNMGKSTLIDSLRLVASESNFRLRRERVDVPRNSVLSEAGTVFLIDKQRIQFPVANVHHEYGAEDAQIIAEFDTGSAIHIAFGSPPDNNCYFAVSMRGAFLENSDAIRRALKGISMSVLPPIASLDENEPLLTADYVRRWSGTYRSPRHFRNLWYHDTENFEDFRTLLKSTWPGADILLPETGVNVETGALELNMFYEEDRISREVAWAGHGMQIWMQILTYLAKFGTRATLVFDEPEISVPSDVQRKLVQVLQDRPSQVIVATHSVDIINEVSPERVVLIDKRHSKGRRLESIRQVQQVVEGLGSVQNVALLSLLRSRFVLFIVGGERRMLSGLARAAGFEGPFPDPRHVSIVELDGEANWRRLKDFNWVLTNTIGEKVRAYVLLDRDYRTDAQVDDLCTTLRNASVGVHVKARFSP